jgi:hypothetical protein
LLIDLKVKFINFFAAWPSEAQRPPGCPLQVLALPIAIGIAVGFPLPSLADCLLHIELSHHHQFDTDYKVTKNPYLEKII